MGWGQEAVRLRGPSTPRGPVGEALGEGHLCGTQEERKSQMPRRSSSCPRQCLPVAGTASHWPWLPVAWELCRPLPGPARSQVPQDAHICSPGLHTVASNVAH